MLSRFCWKTAPNANNAVVPVYRAFRLGIVFVLFPRQAKEGSQNGRQEHKQYNREDIRIEIQA
jgi:hypothetical protein